MWGKIISLCSCLFRAFFLTTTHRTSSIRGSGCPHLKWLLTSESAPFTKEHRDMYLKAQESEEFVFVTQIFLLFVRVQPWIYFGLITWFWSLHCSNAQGHRVWYDDDIQNSIPPDQSSFTNVLDKTQNTLQPSSAWLWLKMSEKCELHSITRYPKIHVGLKHAAARAQRINRTRQDTINIQTSILVTSLLSSWRCCQMSSKGVKVYPQAEWCSRKLWQCKDLSGSFCMCHYQSLVCRFPVCLH